MLNRLLLLTRNENSFANTTRAEYNRGWQMEGGYCVCAIGGQKVGGTRGHNSGQNFFRFLYPVLSAQLSHQVFIPFHETNFYFPSISYGVNFSISLYSSS